MRPFSLDQQQIKRALKRAAGSYNQTNILQKEIADRLLEQLDTLPIQPQYILDVGARTGYTTLQLLQRYPNAQITSLDASFALISQSTARTARVCAQEDQLPFQSAQFDLIVMNLAFDWLPEKLIGLQEWRRMLKPGGWFLFSALGPDTLYELRESFFAVDTQPHVHSFLDMHEIGDMLMKANLSEPVVQSEFIQLTYKNLSRLFKDLRETGTIYAEKNRRKTLLGKNRWQNMLSQYKNFLDPNNKYRATFEIIYAVCWAKEKQIEKENNTVIIPLHSIKKTAIIDKN